VSIKGQQKYGDFHCYIFIISKEIQLNWLMTPVHIIQVTIFTARTEEVIFQK